MTKELTEIECLMGLKNLDLLSMEGLQLLNRLLKEKLQEVN